MLFLVFLILGLAAADGSSADALRRTPHARTLARYNGGSRHAPRFSIERLVPHSISFAAAATRIAFLHRRWLVARCRARRRAGPSLTLLSRDGRRAAADRAGRRPGVRRARRSRRRLPADGPRGIARRDHRDLQRQNDCPDAGPGAGLGAGRLVSLPAPPTRSGRRWLVPVEFISRALALDLRRAARSAQAVAAAGRRRPARAARHGPLRPLGAVGAADDRRDAARDQHRHAGGDRLTIKFDADALDVAEPAAAAAAGAAEPRSGASASSTPTTLGDRSRAALRRLQGRRASRSTRRCGWSIDLRRRADRRRAGAAAPPPPRRRRRPNCRRRSAQPASAIRTIAIDPGHGGEDEGVKGAGGTKEKDSTLAVARRVKARDRSAARHPRAADARRRPQRADRRADGDREQQQGRSVHQPARQRVAAAERPPARRSSIAAFDDERPRRRARRRRRAGARPSAAARATSSSCRGIWRRRATSISRRRSPTMLEQQLRDACRSSAQPDRPRAAARARIGEHAGGADRDGLPDEPGPGKAARRRRVPERASCRRSVDAVVRFRDTLAARRRRDDAGAASPIAGGVAVVAVVARLAAVRRRCRAGTAGATTPAAAAAARRRAPAPPGRKIKARLFYVADDGTRLTQRRARRRVRRGRRSSRRARSSPRRSRRSPSRWCRRFRRARRCARCSSPRAARPTSISAARSSRRTPAARSTRLLTVYTIVNALTANLPAVTVGAAARRRQGSRHARRPRRPAAARSRRISALGTMRLSELHAIRPTTRQPAPRHHASRRTT